MYLFETNLTTLATCIKPHICVIFNVENGTIKSFNESHSIDLADSRIWLFANQLTNFHESPRSVNPGSYKSIHLPTAQQ